MITDIYKDYNINLNSHYFITPFLLHLSNLYARAQKRSYNPNGIFKDIKHENPLIFDIAVHISMEISNFLTIPYISEEEISYITMHIGAEVSRQKNADSKIRTVIIYPNYLDLRSRLHNKILYRFEKEIEIIDIISSPLELTNTESLDLIISTLPVEADDCVDIMVVSSLNEEHIIKALYAKLDEIKDRKNSRFLSTHLSDFVSEKHFLPNLSAIASDKYDVIKQLSNKLSEDAITNEHFFSNVKKREESSSTAFGLLAIPHSIKMDALETRISVGVDAKGFKWDTDNTVKVILLIAINKNDINSFRMLYEALIYLFDNTFNVDYIADAQTGEAFKKRLMNVLAS